MTNSQNASMPEALLELQSRMALERTTFIAYKRTPEAKKYRTAQAALLKTVKNIGRSGNIDVILAAEKTILVNEKRFYGNSPGMSASLDKAMMELTIAERLVPTVRDPAAYKSVDVSHALPKSRIGGVPRDDARKALSSHNTRLLNLDKSRLSATEKEIVNARRSNIKIAGKAYAALQRQALGMPPPEKTRKRGQEMSL